MKKQISFLFAFLTFGIASLAAAATAVTSSGQIAAIEGSKVQITLAGEKPDWLKKGAVIKVTNEAGKVVEQAVKVSEISATGFTYTAKNAEAVSAGKKVSFQKGKLMSGC